MISSFIEPIDYAAEYRIDGYTDAINGADPEHPNDWAYMTGYNEGISDRIQQAKRMTAEFATFFKDDDPEMW